MDFCLQKNKKYIIETKEEILEDDSNQFNINSLEVEKNMYTSSALDNIKENKNENIELKMKNDTLIIEQSNNNSSDKDKVLNTQTKKIDSIDNDEDFWEDIYGRKRNKEGNIIYANNANKYVPPAIRVTITHNINSNEDEKLHFLKKQLKGCLNRVAEHNMHNIVNQVIV